MMVRAALGFAFFAASALVTFWPSAAQASGDYGCGPQWRVVQQDPNGCSNVTMLSPGNDTRSNMLMLLADRRGVAGALPKPDPDKENSEYRFFDEGRRWPMMRWYQMSELFGAMDRPDDNSYDNGTLCSSNVSGAGGFNAAVKSAKGLSEAERASLIKARQALRDECKLVNGSSDPLALLEPSMISAPAKSFYAYLRGAAYFYAGDNAAAGAQFVLSAKSDNAWVKEAAHFMDARIALLLLRDAAIGEYGSFDRSKVIEPGFAKNAEASLSEYLAKYPKGAYRNSAKGLMRRAYWLSNNKAKLAGEYAPLLASRTALGGPLSDIDLIHEIDLKLLPLAEAQAVKDPILHAARALAMMRSNGYYDMGDDAAGNSDKHTLTRAKLETMRPDFAGAPDLYGYLDASFAFHVEKNPSAVLKLIPDSARQSSYTYLQFSRQMLRGLALVALKDKNAGGFWAELAGGVTNPVQRDLLDLAIAMHAERNGGLDQVFGSNTLVKNPRVREVLLKYSASSAILRRAAQDTAAPQDERDIARFTLLYKQLTRGQYSGFINDLTLIPANAPQKSTEYAQPGGSHFESGIFRGQGSHEKFPCPSLPETAKRLAAAPKSANALLCLADFLRVKGFDQNSIDAAQDKDELGGGPSMFPGKPFSRLDLYRGVIADPNSAANDKAYALYRAVRCYAPSRYNSCGGAGASEVQRKAWFMQLKRDYPKSIWAQELTYYW